jgi:hypothetical protein
MRCTLDQTPDFRVIDAPACQASERHRRGDGKANHDPGDQDRHGARRERDARGGNRQRDTEARERGRDGARARVTRGQPSEARPGARHRAELTA